MLLMIPRLVLPLAGYPQRGRNTKEEASSLTGNFFAVSGIRGSPDQKVKMVSPSQNGSE
jgi:hypothetical protein